MDKIKDSLRPLYDCYSQYKALYDFYQNNKEVRTRKEIEERIEYLKKNKCKERNELETLMWCLKVGDELE